MCGGPDGRSEKLCWGRTVRPTEAKPEPIGAKPAPSQGQAAAKPKPSPSQTNQARSTPEPNQTPKNPK